MSHEATDSNSTTPPKSDRSRASTLEYVNRPVPGKPFKAHLSKNKIWVKDACLGT